MKLYVKVSEDDLELPEAVAESRAELARMLGYGKNYAYTCIERAKISGRYRTCEFCGKVWDQEGEEDDAT